MRQFWSKHGGGHCEIQDGSTLGKKNRWWGFLVQNKKLISCFVRVYKTKYGHRDGRGS